MVDEQLHRSASAFLLKGTVLEHAVHVLAVEHVVYIAPTLLIVAKLIHTHRFAGLPVTVDE